MLVPSFIPRSYLEQHKRIQHLDQALFMLSSKTHNKFSKTFRSCTIYQRTHLKLHKKYKAPTLFSSYMFLSNIHHFSVCNKYLSIFPTIIFLLFIFLKLSIVSTNLCFKVYTFRSNFKDLI